MGMGLHGTRLRGLRAAFILFELFYKVPFIIYKKNLFLRFYLNRMINDVELVFV